MKPLIEISCPPKHLKDYSIFTPKVVERVSKLAKNLQGVRVTHVNATAVGGGVAEMLRSLIPLQNDIGFSSKWYVIPPNEEFFNVTKEIHNFLQGKPGNLTNKQKKIYLDYNKNLANLLSEIKTDILIIHDPQPAAALSFLKQLPSVCLWRCHVDTTDPNQSVWNFLVPYLRIYNPIVFSTSEFVPHDFNQDQVNIITPVIDPLIDKNRLTSKAEAKNHLQKLGIDVSKPLVTQVSRLDPWKDPIGVIDSFFLAKKAIPKLQLALVAQTADDDPEGIKIYQKVRDYIKGKKDILLLVNLPENDLAVNAFQTGSDMILQKSIREGFSLAVTEAMWKGTVVIGGNVGGIKAQIQDGVNSFLVNSIEETAQKIVYVLNHPEAAQKISAVAHRSVQSQFLIPHKLLNYVQLFKKILSPGSKLHR
ncbi:MAG: glycosyltransferase [Patescibacteria group bacterium]|nr:glycosyltransferase [Patescibacteria group bacterium]